MSLNFISNISSLDTSASFTRPSRVTRASITCGLEHHFAPIVTRQFTPHNARNFVWPTLVDVLHRLESRIAISLIIVLLVSPQCSLCFLANITVLLLELQFTSTSHTSGLRVEFYSISASFSSNFATHCIETQDADWSVGVGFGLSGLISE